MTVLVICTWFPPDTAIAAVRPFMLAKHLAERGHYVVVLKDGDIAAAVDRDFYNQEFNFEVISTKRLHVEKDNKTGIEVKERKMHFLPENARNCLVRTYHEIAFPFEIAVQYRLSSAKKNVINSIDRHFDVIFSTYGELENIFAGQYAARRFSCPLIQDFRDPVVIPRLRSRIWNLCMRPIEKRAVQKADLCTTIAEAMTQQMECYGTGTRCVTLHNGYDHSKYNKGDIPVRKNQLVLCYTGTIYPDQRSAAIPLFQSMKELMDSGKINRRNIRFVYAGGAGEVWKALLKQISIEEIYEDHGYLSKDETERLQRESDIYLVLSWNRKENQGMISGKFYEGIRAVKPILSVIGGNLPNSELYQMNEKYHYGYCFEAVRGQEEAEKLKQYILDAYNQKIETGKVDYHQNPQLEEDFCYENLAKKLESLCYELVGKGQEQKEVEI